MGIPHTEAAPTPGALTLWERRLGPTLTVTLALLLLLFERGGFKIPNPVLLFALTIVVSAFLGGVRSGLIAVAVTFAFTLWSWSRPGQLFSYQAQDLQRLGVQLLTMPAMAVLVGLLKQRSERHTRELADALAQVRQLEGLVHICAYCKGIQDAGGLWTRIEEYVALRPGAAFTHGICPACEDRLEREDGAQGRPEGQ